MTERKENPIAPPISQESSDESAQEQPNEPSSMSSDQSESTNEQATADPAEQVSTEEIVLPDNVTELAKVRAQDENTVALVAGDAVTALPTDLYIPPDAMEVFLDTFEGPLDLLLYLIRRQNLDILNIRVAEITAQYMSYIDMMQALQLELAGEYLLMAAMLAEIKSRMLLPKPEGVEEDEDDPRAELIRRLQEYEQIKSAAENIDELPRLERDLHLVHAEKPEVVREVADPEVELKEVLLALAKVLHRAEMYEHHAIEMEPLSVRERMTQILSKMEPDADFVSFATLFTVEEGRLGVIVTFLAIMELVRESMLDFVQAEPYAPIYVKAAGAL